MKGMKGNVAAHILDFGADMTQADSGAHWGTVLCCFDLFWQLQIQGMGKGMGKMGKGLNIWQPMFMKDMGIAANQRT